MSIYVDRLREWGTIVGYRGKDAGQAQRVGARHNHQWCHLFTDNVDFSELHLFAAQIGMRRSWFQGDHYDLVPPKREKAVSLGAIEVDDATAVKLWNHSPQADVAPTWGIPTDGRIPALSIRIPWTIALSDYDKRIENRLSWKSCDYRGPLILHAASWPSDPISNKNETEFYCTLDDMMARASAAGHYMKFLINDLLATRGHAFAICNLVDCIRSSAALDILIRAGLPPAQRSWYMGGFALVLENVRKIPLVRCNGAPGLFGIAPGIYRTLNIS